MGRIWRAFTAKAEKNGVSYTSFDLIKLFALFNMTVDHVGVYFFPHNLWLRMIGRLSFPVWFFLVGYSRSMSIGRNFWVYAAVLLAAPSIVGRSIFPLNAVVSIILSRLAVNCCRASRFLPARLPELMTAFMILVLFTDPLFEYGTLAFMFAILGWMVREGKTEHFTTVLLTSYVSFVGWQVISFGFNLFQTTYVALGAAWLVRWLANPGHEVIWPDWRASKWKTAIAVLSRNTLFYYFIHRLSFELLSNVLNGQSFGFAIKWFTIHN